MAGSVTVKDVARVAEVSIGTVSRVFNNHHNVTEEVRQRVLRAASELGYSGQSGHEARARENGHSRLIKELGFIYYSSTNEQMMANPFWSHILYGAESAARKANIKVTYRAISEFAQDADALLEALAQMKLGGILLVGPAELATISLIKELKLPLLLVDNCVPGLPVDAVLSDNFEGARTAVDYLISEGHTRIGFIGGPTIKGPRPINKIYTIERRAAGYRTALRDAGLPVNYDWYEEGNLTPEGGYEACKRLLAKHDTLPFSALFCANDATAIGAMKALREADLRIPEDVSLVGFDDIEMVEHLTPALTTMRVDKEALGYIAVKHLLMRVADPDAVSSTSILNVELIKRDSVIARKQ